MWSAVRNSDKIISVSQFTKDDILEWYRTNGDKIKVIYNGLDHDQFNISSKDQVARTKDFKDKHGIEGDYILYTGAWKKHKNILGLLKAFEQYVTKCHSERSEESSEANTSRKAGSRSFVDTQDDKQIQLVLVGKIDIKEPEVTAEIERMNEKMYKCKNNKMIITAGFVDEADLPIVYAGALLYVMPSFSEGFGWPPLEAMACGTPVVSSNLSCMPEILGDAALYFDPYKIEKMAGAIEKVATDDQIRQELIQKGLKQVQKYNWDKTAKETFEVYKSAFSSN
jgi:glycosyltransferase involved in cell wall biosynthesis